MTALKKFIQTHWSPSSSYRTKALLVVSPVQWDTSVSARSDFLLFPEQSMLSLYLFHPLLFSRPVHILDVCNLNTYAPNTPSFCLYVILHLLFQALILSCLHSLFLLFQLPLIFLFWLSMYSILYLSAVLILLSQCISNTLVARNVVFNVPTQELTNFVNAWGEPFCIDTVFTHAFMIQKYLKTTSGHFSFLSTKLLNKIRVLFRNIIAHVPTQWKYQNWISTCNLFYLQQFGFNLTTLSLQLPKKSLPLYKCISIFQSQYKHSCEPITSKFKSGLFLSLALLENVEYCPREKLPGSIQRNFFFLFCFKWDTLSFLYYHL